MKEITMDTGYFSGWLKRYRYYLRMRNYSPRTIQSYEHVIKHLGYYLWLKRHAEPEDIPELWKDLSKARLDTEVETPYAAIEEYLAFLTSLYPYKPKTLHRMISAMSSFYRFLYTQGGVEKNPMINIERPKIKDQEMRYLKHNQVITLINSIADQRDRLVVRTIYATGVRVSELCGIDVENIDFEDHTIRIRGKGGKIRTVFIDGDTLVEIREFIGERQEGPVFIGQQGEHISPRTVQHIFKKYAPLGITPHKIRHSYASELYRRSKNLKVVQENLGHTSIKTTEIYLHTDLDERKRIYTRYFPLSDDNVEE